MQPMDTQTMPLRLWEWCQALLLGANLVLTALDLGGYRPVSLALFYALLLCAGAIHGAGWWLWAYPSGWRVHPASWWGIPFLLFAGANAWWLSPTPWLGRLDWLGWLGIWLAYWIALNGIRSASVRAIIAGAVLCLGVAGVAMGAYQVLADHRWIMGGLQQAPQFFGRASGFFGIPNSLAALLLLLIPPTFAAALERSQPVQLRVVWFYLGGLFLVGLGMTLSRGGWFGLSLALAVWGGWRGLRSRGPRRLSILAMVAALAVALMAMAALVPDLRLRIDAAVRDRGEVSRAILWRAAWQIWRESPWLGAGAGGFTTRFEAHRPWHFQDDPQWPHNEALGLLCDYGAVGASLALIALVGAVACAGEGDRTGRKGTEAQLVASDYPGRRRHWLGREVAAVFGSRLLREGLWCGLGAFTFQSFLEFSLKIPALALLVALVFAEAVGRRRQCGVEHQEGAGTIGANVHRGLGSVCVAAACGAIALSFPVVRAEGIRDLARRDLERLAASVSQDPRERRHLLVHAAGRLESACSLSDQNGAAWADLSYARSLLLRDDPGKLAELSEPLLASAREAVTRAPLSADSWVRLSVALDARGDWIEGGRAILRATQLAPNSLNTCYYYAYHLSLKPYTRENALAVAMRCVQVDPSHGPSHRLWRELVAAGVRQ